MSVELLGKRIQLALLPEDICRYFSETNQLVTLVKTKTCKFTKNCPNF